MCDFGKCFLAYAARHVKNHNESQVIDDLLTGKKVCSFNTDPYRKILSPEESLELYNKIFSDFETDDKSNIKSHIQKYVSRCIDEGVLSQENGTRLKTILLKTLASNKFDYERISFNDHGDIENIENIIFVNKNFKNIKTRNKK